MRSFKVGESTTADVLPALERFHLAPDLNYPTDCETPDTSYAMHVRSLLFNHITYNFPVLRRVGLVPWGAEGAVSFTKGKLCYLTLSVETTQMILGGQRRLAASVKGADREKCEGTTAEITKWMSYQAMFDCMA